MVTFEVENDGGFTRDGWLILLVAVGCDDVESVFAWVA